MQLFLDIDGVLLNFEHAFVRWLNDAYGMGLPGDYETRSWFFDDLMSREQLWERWDAFLESDYCARMLPLVEPERFNALAGLHEVHLLTNFPSAFMAKREENLAEVGLVYQSLHHGGLHSHGEVPPPTKAELVNRLRKDGGPALFVDDHPDNCLDVLKNCSGVEVWLMSRRFNRDFHHPGLPRADGWEALFERLEQ